MERQVRSGGGLERRASESDDQESRNQRAGGGVRPAQLFVFVFVVFRA